MKKIEELQNGDLFRISLSKKIWVKGTYCKSNKGWECTDIDDTSNYRYVKKGKLVEEI